MEKDKKPHPIDIHVGARVRMRRTMLGMSQDKLGDSLGLTFQQIQKYEKGVNRIGASRLFEIAKVLEIPIQFLFEDFDSFTNTPYGFAENAPDSDSSMLMDFLSSPEGIQLCRHFAQIEDPRVRRRVIDLVKTLSDKEGE
ncbi:MAG: XRE family transcriptional regulator [Parvularculaceae bacterium]|nr:MAG: XRE family transcriptional regulator [Parvularculaceae bacterium]